MGYRYFSVNILGGRDLAIREMDLYSIGMELSFGYPSDLASRFLYMDRSVCGLHSMDTFLQKLVITVSFNNWKVRKYRVINVACYSLKRQIGFKSNGISFVEVYKQVNWLMMWARTRRGWYTMVSVPSAMLMSVICACATVLEYFTSLMRGMAVPSLRKFIGLT